MKQLILILATLGAVALATGDEPKQEERPMLAFWTRAELYRQMPQPVRRTYLSGWLDARLNAGLVGGSAKVMQAERDCVKDMTLDQITAIVDKYIEANPETWNRPAATEADDALRRVCPAISKASDEDFKRRRN